MADPTDIQLLSDQVKIEGRQVVVNALDLCVDSSARRSEHNTPDRRALVHDDGDALTVNYAYDYPGGVTINGLKTINAKPHAPHVMSSPSAVHLMIAGNTKIGGNLHVDGTFATDVTFAGHVRFHAKESPGPAMYGTPHLPGQPPPQPPPPPAPLDLADVIYTLQQEIAALKKKVGL